MPKRRARPMPRRRTRPTASRPVSTLRRGSAAIGPTARETRIGNEVRSLWQFMIGPVAAYFLAISLLSIGPDWAALLGYGHRGTWTAAAISCEPKSCTTHGTFVSDNGKDVRTGVGMESEWTAAVGTRFRAIDSGASGVFPPGGGPAWIESTLGLAITGPIFACWAWTVPIAAVKRRRRQRHACDQPSTTG